MHNHKFLFSLSIGGWIILGNVYGALLPNEPRLKPVDIAALADDFERLPLELFPIIAEHTPTKALFGLVQQYPQLKPILQQRLDAGLRLIDAVKCGNLTDVISLVENGAYIDMQDKNGNTPLIWAVYKGDWATPDLRVYVRIAQYLIEAGANLNAQNNKRGTALIYAAAKINKVSAQRLIQAGASADILNIDGQTALMYAIKHNMNEDIANFLIEYSDLNIQGANGETALMCAITNGRANLVVRLIGANAEVNIRDKQGYTALTHAYRVNFYNIVPYLVRAGGIDSSNGRYGTGELRDVRSLQQQLFSPLNEDQLHTTIERHCLNFASKK
jgi:ankyrin repeat protein